MGQGAVRLGGRHALLEREMTFTEIRRPGGPVIALISMKEDGIIRVDRRFKPKEWCVLTYSTLPFTYREVPIPRGRTPEGTYHA